ncbi:hypothetical protein CQA53_03625 [Helicobacter didelphidarum]|uniref:TonB C-terminal domain-containing protein n=1 Tax=Helicobacter didelphidarum TaxID=2040648 RepID=A0A3D8IMQ4_9HELI|nr:TonB C-terminal domain-containing protein [Helicobacter didelphidarum]RDU66538.1 hypothetical protein CQA53_03625 [Helicobacter didelphidarum]
MKQDIIIHNNNFSLHFLSACGAFIIYILLLLLLLGGFQFYKEHIRYGEMPDSEFIAEIADGIEIAEIIESTTPSEQIQEQIKTPLQQDLIIPQTQKQDSITPTQSQQKSENSSQDSTPKPAEVNLADMFANVSDETLQHKKVREEIQRQEEIKLRKKQLEDAQKERAEKLAQNVAAIGQSTKALQQATQNLQQNVKQAIATKVNLEKPKFMGNSKDKVKYDEWYAQIEKILMTEWRKSSKFYQATTSAKVRIRIDSHGKLNYVHMIRQSPYGEYNSSVFSFLKSMEQRIFPAPPGDTIEMSLELENTLKH